MGFRVTVDNVPRFGVPIREDNGDLVTIVVGAPLIFNAAVIAAAPDLLALAHRYADECAECGGNGVVWTNTQDPQDAKEVQCQDCADIRTVIDRAEGRA
jgi:ribosomal protein S27E